jgi:hypothetical protein
MNCVHLKNYSILPILIFLLALHPSTIISEPRYKQKTSIPPLTILYSGITKLDTSDALMLRIDSGNPDDIVSVCTDERVLINQNTETSTIQWKPGKNCKIPLITYKGKNYILPLNQQNISMDVLADISTETLKNTIAITTLLSTDARLSGLKTRKIIRNISAVLESRDTPFLLPLAGAKMPEKDSFLPNSSRPFRADTTDGVHHGWDFYTAKGAPVLAVEEGQIIHIKRDFSWKEMNHFFDASDALGQQENLDIYRGNTVYLKTMSGHVAIYAHM